MSNVMLSIDRAQLYEQVWSEAIHKLCKQYSLSDRGLGKLCARHNVPVPPRGYWARVAHGQRPKRPPLPTLKPGQANTIRIERRLHHPRSEEVAPQPIPAAVLYERQPEHRVTVPDDLALNHRLVREARRLLRGVKPDDRGILRPPTGCLQVRVSRTAQPRALRIMEALFDAMAVRGWTIGVTTETEYNRRPTTRTLVKVLDEEIGFGFEERAKHVPHVLTAYEKDSIKRGYEPYLPPWDLVTSGVLVLQILTGWPQARGRASARRTSGSNDATSRSELFQSNSSVESMRASRNDDRTRSRRVRRRVRPGSIS
jgi:hypothetical protein